MKPHAERANESFNFIVDSLCTVTQEFITGLTLAREMGKRADAGDKDALQIIEVIYRFERFLRIPPYRPQEQKPGTV